MLHQTAVAMTAALLLIASPIDARAQQPYDRLEFSFGGGLVVPNPEVRDQLGNGYSLVFGVQYRVAPIVAIEGLLGTNAIGDKEILIPVSLTPATPPVPTNFFVDMSMQFATANLLIQAPGGTLRPYGVVGMGVYGRPVRLTTNGAGWVAGVCNPWWYTCDPGGFVPVEQLIGQRTSVDLGMDFGGGLSFQAFFTEIRYHYMWGPAVGASDVSANGKFLITNLGVRF